MSPFISIKTEEVFLVSTKLIQNTNISSDTMKQTSTYIFFYFLLNTILKILGDINIPEKESNCVKCPLEWWVHFWVRQFHTTWSKSFGKLTYRKKGASWIMVISSWAWSEDSCHGWERVKEQSCLIMKTAQEWELLEWQIVLSRSHSLRLTSPH